MRHFLLGAVLLVGPATLSAQQAAVPAVVTQGLELLRADSAAAATAMWARTWTGPADSGKAETILAGMRQTRDVAGPFRGYDVVRTQAITPHLLRIYILMLFERQPIYAQFVVYNPGASSEEWAITTVTWHTDAKQAWPSDLWVH